MSKFARAELLACLKRESPKPMSSQNVSRADRKPCQWNADKLKKAEKNSRVSYRATALALSAPLISAATLGESTLPSCGNGERVLVQGTLDPRRAAQQAPGTRETGSPPGPA